MPDGWVVWTPGEPDVGALVKKAVTKQGGVTLRRAIGEVEKELVKDRGDVVQVGARLADPRAVTGTVRLTHWPRGESDGTSLDAAQHLRDTEARGPARGLLYEHREVSLVTVPAGPSVLSNEIWRKRWGVRSMVTLTTDIFPTGTASVFRLRVSSGYRELQPELMADLSLMAHSFTVGTR